MSKTDANDIAAAGGADALRQETLRLTAAASTAALKKYPTLGDLVNKHKGMMREPIINGILRVGEIMTVVAPPKAGKTWLSYDFAVSVATGGFLLQVPAWICKKGPVVIIDNENHEETLGARIPKVIEAMGLKFEDLKDNLICISLRGQGVDIKALGGIITDLMPLQPRLVILDALYRFYEDGMSENDNAQMTKVYNMLDNYARMMKTAAFIVVHHTSKGSQAEKSITEVGAGANAGARASDSYMVIREHEEAFHYVLEAEVRSWPRPDPIVCEYKYPRWKAIATADPKQLKGLKPTKEKKALAPADDSAFLVVLTNDWKPHSCVVADLTRELKWTQQSAKNFVAQVITKHNLHGLHRDDGIRACGQFEVRKENTWIFRLKTEV